MMGRGRCGWQLTHVAVAPLAGPPLLLRVALDRRRVCFVNPVFARVARGDTEVFEVDLQATSHRETDGGTKADGARHARRQRRIRARKRWRRRSRRGEGGAGYLVAARVAARRGATRPAGRQGGAIPVSSKVGLLERGRWILRSLSPLTSGHSSIGHSRRTLVPDGSTDTVDRQEGRKEGKKERRKFARHTHAPCCTRSSSRPCRSSSCPVATRSPSRRSRSRSPRSSTRRPRGTAWRARVTVTVSGSAARDVLTRHHAPQRPRNSVR